MAESILSQAEIDALMEAVNDSNAAGSDEPEAGAAPESPDAAEAGENINFEVNFDPVKARLSMPIGSEVKVVADRVGWDIAKGLPLRMVSPRTFQLGVNATPGTIAYKFYITPPAGLGEPFWFPEGGEETNIKEVIKPASPKKASAEPPDTAPPKVKKNAAPKKPDAAADSADADDSAEAAPAQGKKPNAKVIPIRMKAIQAAVDTVMDSSRTPEGAKDFPALLRKLEFEMRDLPKEINRKAVILECAGNRIIRNRAVPGDIRMAFIGQPPVASFEEFEARIESGAKLFRERVLINLSTNPTAREALKMKHEDTEITDHHARERFDAICDQYIFAGSVPVIGMAVQKVDFDSSHAEANTPAAELELAVQKLQTERLQQLRSIIERAGRKPELENKMNPKKRAKLLDSATRLVIGGTMAAAPWLGVLALGAKVAVETATGKKAGNLIAAAMSDDEHERAGFLGGKKGAYAEWRDSEAGAGSILGGRAWNSLKTSIPLLGPWLDKDRKGNKHGTGEHTPHAVHSPAEHMRKIDSAIAVACGRVVQEDVSLKAA